MGVVADFEDLESSTLTSTSVNEKRDWMDDSRDVQVSSRVLEFGTNYHLIHFRSISDQLFYQSKSTLLEYSGNITSSEALQKGIYWNRSL